MPAAPRWTAHHDRSHDLASDRPNTGRARPAESAIAAGQIIWRDLHRSRCVLSGQRLKESGVRKKGRRTGARARDHPESEELGRSRIPPSAGRRTRGNLVGYSCFADGRDGNENAPFLGGASVSGNYPPCAPEGTFRLTSNQVISVSVSSLNYPFLTRQPSFDHVRSMPSRHLAHHQN